MRSWTIPAVPIRTRHRIPSRGCASGGPARKPQRLGVGDTLDDLAEGIRALFSAGSVPDELTREIAVTVGDAA
jgi:hypothetical protein